MLEFQTGGRGLGVEVGERVAAVQAEPHDDETVVAQVCSDASEHDTFGAGGKEGHHVADTQRGVERFRHTLRRQIKLSQVSDKPSRAGMIGPGCIDQLRIGVHTDHDMPACGQLGANSSRPTAGIQHTRPARQHRIEQPSLPAKVHSLGSHAAEPFEVPLGMTGAVRRDPTRQLTHPSTVAGHNTARSAGHLLCAAGCC